jgi:hypothetical protein
MSTATLGRRTLVAPPDPCVACGNDAQVRIVYRDDRPDALVCGRCSRRLVKRQSIRKAASFLLIDEPPEPQPERPHVFDWCQPWRPLSSHRACRRSYTSTSGAHKGERRVCQCTRRGCPCKEENR